MKSLNLKHPEIHELASELARRRGTSITGAIVDAVRGELAREIGRESRKGLAGRLLRIGRDCAAHMKPGTKSSDHASMLYDDKGLPR